MQVAAPSIAAEILLLSENEGEVSLVRRAIEKSCLNVVDDCPAVLRFLRREPPYQDSPRPDLILLDLDLSDPDQCDTLEQIKRDPSFKRIPLVVLATNDSTRNVFQAYDLHANAYIAKPSDQDSFVRVIRATLAFWLNLARLPQE